ncbi:MAG: hypothetical protein CM1200mP12_14130 [Gammaproteobacteria bacterium]|nr:MAG: hypothetical protein CM1200mP12_14130 [Gammaproteobacteria bacterium]
MSITAFDSSLIEDLGLQGANDLMDQLPATTRDPYDVGSVVLEETLEHWVVTQGCNLL